MGIRTHQPVRHALPHGSGKQTASLCLVFVLVVSVLPLAAQNAQRIIPVESQLYDDLSALYTASGKVLPSRARPYTEDQFRFYLDALSYGNLTATLRAVYDGIRKEIEPGDPDYSEEDFAVEISGSSSLLAYRHDQLGGDTREEGTYTWLFGYEERSPLLNVPFEVRAFGSLYADIELTFRQDYRTIDDSRSPEGREAFQSDAGWTNVSANPVAYDVFFPFRAFLSGGGDHWTLQFGRDRLSWGSGRTGNFMISSYPDFFDLLRFSAWWRGFTFTTMYSVFDPNVAGGETYLAFAAHRLEFNLFGKAVIAVSEALSYGRTSFPELVSDLNPMMIFHSWFIPERANSILSLEIDAAVLPFLRLYGQGVVDEFVTPVESEAGAVNKVKAMGYLAGAEADVPLSAGIVSVRGEWARTDPWLYNRNAYPYHRSQRRVWSYPDPAIDLYITKPIGYEYGPDSMVTCLGLEYRALRGYSLGLDLTMLIQGEKNLTSPYAPRPDDTTPTGIPERQNILHATGSWAPLDWLSLDVDGWLRFTGNEGHAEGRNRSDSELALTLTFTW